MTSFFVRKSLCYLIKNILAIGYLLVKGKTEKLYSLLLFIISCFYGFNGARQ